MRSDSRETLEHRNPYLINGRFIVFRTCLRLIEALVVITLVDRVRDSLCYVRVIWAYLFFTLGRHVFLRDFFIAFRTCLRLIETLVIITLVDQVRDSPCDVRAI